MESECPAPLVPDEVDLTDFKFMPLEVQRLLASEFFVSALDTQPIVAAVSVVLWAASWHQRPAGSLPDNDLLLARIAMVDRSVWRDIRDAVLAPWVLCSDGRWYHPVVAEKALEAWQTKCSYASRDSAFSHRQSLRAKKRWEKAKDATADAKADAGRNATADAARIAGRNANESNSKSKSNSNSKRNYVPQSAKALSSDADASDPTASKSKISFSADFEAWWKLYPKKEGKIAAYASFQRALKRTDLLTLMSAVRAYAKRRADDPDGHQFTKHPTTWLNQGCWDDEEPPKAARKYPPGYVPMAANGG